MSRRGRREPSARDLRRAARALEAFAEQRQELSAQHRQSLLRVAGWLQRSADGRDAGTAPALIYVVRWPAFNVSLVRARDEEELWWKLDEESDPSGCRWAVYEGPLWINLDLPVSFELSNEKLQTADELEFSGVEGLLETAGDAFLTRIGGEETRELMLEVITPWAFPHLAPVLQEAQERMNHDDDPPDHHLVIAALRAEVLPLLRQRWRSQHVRRLAAMKAGKAWRSPEDGSVVTWKMLEDAVARISSAGKEEDDGDGDDDAS